VATRDIARGYVLSIYYIMTEFGLIFTQIRRGPEGPLLTTLLGRGLVLVLQRRRNLQPPDLRNPLDLPLTGNAQAPFLPVVRTIMEILQIRQEAEVTDVNTPERLRAAQHPVDFLNRTAFPREVIFLVRDEDADGALQSVFRMVATVASRRGAFALADEVSDHLVEDVL